MSRHIATAEPLKLNKSQLAVANYMAKGRTLTNKVALAALNIGSLSSRISELQRKGFTITKREEVDEYGKKFIKYDFDQNADQPLF